jgi:hypothetical protein
MFTVALRENREIAFGIWCNIGLYKKKQDNLIVVASCTFKYYS